MTVNTTPIEESIANIDGGVWNLVDWMEAMSNTLGEIAQLLGVIAQGVNPPGHAALTEKP